MTLVMDGVRRHGLVTQAMVRPMPQLAPARPMIPVVQPLGGRPRMDGVRRAVPTPRELLDTVVMPQPVPAAVGRLDMAGPSMDGANAIPSDGRRLRTIAAFGLVATALVTASVATAAGLGTGRQAAAVPATNAGATSTQSQAASAAAAVAAKPAPTPAVTGLQSMLAAFVAGQPDIYGIVVKNLSTGETATVNSDRVIESASMYKLFVADAIYHGVDTGKLSLSQSAGGGSRNSVQGCLKLMITISDNTCGRALRSLAGLSYDSSSLKTDGYINTVLTGDYPQTTAADIATMYERLYNNTLNSPSANDAFLALLKGQLVNNRLPQGLPAGTVMAHKTGDLDGYMHDGGIVYGPKANYLVVMMGAPGANPSTFAGLSQQVWSHFEQ